MPTKMQIEILITLKVRVSNLATLLNFCIELKVDIQFGGRDSFSSTKPDAHYCYATQNVCHSPKVSIPSLLGLVSFMQGQAHIESCPRDPFSKRDKCA